MNGTRLRAQKRGGGVIHVPVQLDTAETRYGHEPADNCTPEQCYERQLGADVARHRAATAARRIRKRRQREFVRRVESCLVGGRESQPYAELAVQLSMNEGAVKVAVHRLRKRYRKLLRAEIAQTMAATGGRG